MKTKTKETIRIIKSIAASLEEFEHGKPMPIVLEKLLEMAHPAFEKVDGAIQNIETLTQNASRLAEGVQNIPDLFASFFGKQGGKR